MSDYPRDLAAALSTSIQDGITRRLQDVHTAIPGIVESYDAETQTAAVAVAVNRFTAAGARVPGPKLPSVPVLFPKSSRGHIVWPLEPGDEVLLVFSERDIDGWRTSGRQSDPLSVRKFDLTDAVCIPGCHSQGNAAPIDTGDEDSLVLQFDGVKIVCTPAGKVKVGKVGSTQTEPLVLGTTLTAFLSALCNLLTTTPIGLTTTPGNPIGPNPAFAAALNPLVSQYLTTPATSILSQVAFTERGP